MQYNLPFPTLQPFNVTGMVLARRTGFAPIHLKTFARQQINTNKHDVFMVHSFLF